MKDLVNVFHWKTKQFFKGSSDVKFIGKVRSKSRFGCSYAYLFREIRLEEVIITNMFPVLAEYLKKGLVFGMSQYLMKVRENAQSTVIY